MNCQLIKQLAKRYGISYIVAETGHFQRICPALQVVYQDETFRVYKVVLTFEIS